MKKNLFSQSKEMSTEYCISIVQIGEVKDVENSDFLGVVMVNGREIIVRKDVVKEGDVMLYASNECQLNDKFLSLNNLYEDIELNSNYEEVNRWLQENQDLDEEDIKTYMQAHRGYFEKRGRVRMKKLRGVVSMGFLFRFDELKTAFPVLNEVTDEEFASLVGIDFDTIDGELFVKAYVPPVASNHHGDSQLKKRNNRVKKFNRMVPGQWSFHYSSESLNKYIQDMHPQDDVTISVKKHGHSLIIGNVLVKKPKWGGWYEKIFCYLPGFLQFTKLEYDIVESSRTVIINDSINPNRREGYFGGMVQKNIALWAERIGRYIPEGVTIYGEVCGFYEGSNSAIQVVGGKVYDYKSNPGENSLMIYRITNTESDGSKTEYDIDEVLEFTRCLMANVSNDGHPEVAARIQPIDILYQGKLADLYPDLDIHDHWCENLLERMKKDKEHFGMEENEPLCKNKCPREGIVIRKNGDDIPRAWKLKTLAFLQKEASDMDKGITSDEEMMQGY